MSPCYGHSEETQRDSLHVFTVYLGWIINLDIIEMAKCNIQISIAAIFCERLNKN